MKKYLLHIIICITTMFVSSSVAYAIDGQVGGRQERNNNSTSIGNKVGGDVHGDNMQQTYNFQDGPQNIVKNGQQYNSQSGPQYNSGGGQQNIAPGGKQDNYQGGQQNIYNGPVNITNQNPAESAVSQNTTSAPHQPTHKIQASPPQFLIEKYRPYEVSYRCAIIPNERNQTIRMAGETYTNGIILEDGGVVLANLRGECKTIRYTAGHLDGSYMQKMVLQIYRDEAFYKEYELSPEAGPVPQEIEVDGVRIVKFSLKNNSGTSSDSMFCLMNMTVE